MAGTVVLGCADQSLGYELRAQLSEAADLEVVGVAETTTELARLVVESEPDLVVVHDVLGPEPIHQVLRDLGIRRPGTVALVLTTDAGPGSMAAAMDSGARGVLVHPFAFAEVQQRIGAALEWARHMQALLADGGDRATGVRGRARVVAVAGTKGGVGTTTVVTHLAWDIRRELPSLKVLVLDLDLEKGDVTSFIEARYRTSVADLAKVADDLSLRTVQDAVLEHVSGIHLLLPPEDVREALEVTPQAIRQILALLRQQYDVVLVDVGARVTPVQAAVVEVADEVVALVTPDLVSIRALRRNLGWWESLQVRKPDEVHVLLNRSSKSVEVQPETVRRLSPAPLLEAVLPDMGGKLESSVNSRSPEYVTDVAWWRGLRAVGREVGVVRPTEQVEPTTTPAAVEGTRRTRRDQGSASIELLGSLPAVAIILAVMWQISLTGLTYMWAGHAASAAARSVALGQTYEQTVDAAKDRMPGQMKGQTSVRVGVPTPADVRVSVRVPAVMPGVVSTPFSFDVDRTVVREP